MCISESKAVDAMYKIMLFVLGTTCWRYIGHVSKEAKLEHFLEHIKQNGCEDLEVKVERPLRGEECLRHLEYA